jgi:hypothetical protein
VGDHPVKVPAILVGEWLTEAGELGLLIPTNLHHLANRAAQWGADQELEACEEWLLQERIFSTDSYYLFQLRAARRPKPPTLAEQGMEALRSTPCTEQRHYDAMFAALTRLAELEANQ